jgi:hypothetical protein
MGTGRRFARVVENERRRREANREIEREAREEPAPGAGDLAARELEFFCACGRADCEATLLLTLSEYEAIHAERGRFIVAPGHVDPAVERVVAARRGYLVVDKQDG